MARGKRAGDALRGVVAQGVVDHPDTDTLGQSNHSPDRLEHLIGESVRQYDARKPPFLQPARAIRNHAASGARKVSRPDQSEDIVAAVPAECRELICVAAYRLRFFFEKLTV
ncbi:hypothetical protein BSFA1_77700 (plasmid) [Burkholderia sp. SFA1]|nr:hypothetical protein BSFA1_77700 [Burkholderia sp. SFA1]